MSRNLFEISDEEIQNILCRLFSDKEWNSTISYYYLKKTGVSDACTTANIIAILQQCDITNQLLKQHIRTAIYNTSVYQKGHLSYFEPLVDGEPTCLSSKFLGRLVDMSPDADDTCLLRIVNEDAQHIDKLVEELIFYVVNNKNFRLIKNQNDKLKGTDNTFLTWFPRKDKCHHLKIETIDISVDANILWLLSKTDNLAIPGVKETLQLIENTVNTNIILRDPFVVSPYYPNPAIILYNISRGIVFGNIETLYRLKDKILSLNASCEIKSILDALCIISTKILWGSDSRTGIGFEYLNKGIMKADDLFIAHFFLGKCPLCFALSRKPVFQIKYGCEALQWAMLLWIKQKMKAI